MVGEVAKPRITEPIAKVEANVLKYELVAYDAAGNVFSSQSYLASFFDVHGNEREQVHFTRYIQLPEKLRIAGTKIQLRVGRTVLDEIIMSQYSPEVRVTAPLGGERWNIGTRAKISWVGNDRDSKELQYTVQYSPDGGILWIPLASGIKGTAGTEMSLLVDPARIPGTGRAGGFVRVLASDGFNTGEGKNEKPFWVESKAPKVYIDSPASGQTFGTRDIIPLKGHGFDLEDGELPDSALSWDFENGHLGTGSSIDVVRIGPGDHVITLTGTDSNGMKGIARIKIRVLIEEIVPALVQAPTVRAGAGLGVRANIEPSSIGSGESAVLHAIVYNAGNEPAEEVKLTVGLPPELKLLGEIPIIWKVIPPGEAVEAEFEVTGKEIGLYEIGLEASSANLRPGVASVFFGVEKEAPVIRPEETTTTPPKETTTTSPEKTTTPETSPEETEKETETEAPIPGFEVVPVLLAIPFLLWLRKRRHRR